MIKKMADIAPIVPPIKENTDDSFCTSLV